MARWTGEANYFRYYKRLGPIAKLATSYIDKSVWLCYSFFVYTDHERERGLGGITVGKRQDVGVRLRRRPGLTPRAVAPRAGTPAATLRRHARVEKPPMLMWVRMARRTRARMTILDERACGLHKVRGSVGARAAQPSGNETSVSRRGTRGHWPRRGGRRGPPRQSTCAGRSLPGRRAS
jgi:hypothetical protein